MNIQQFSKQLLEEALSTGTITLENGTIRELKTSEILSVCKYVMSNGIVNEGSSTQEEDTNIPSELTSFDPTIPYRPGTDIPLSRPLP